MLHGEIEPAWDMVLGTQDFSRALCTEAAMVEVVEVLKHEFLLLDVKGLEFLESLLGP